MKALAAAVVVALAVLAPAARAKDVLPDLASGSYEITLDGLLCHTCSRIVLEEVSALPQVGKAQIDFDRGLLELSVRPGQTLKIWRLRRALKRATKRADLGTEFTIQSVVYKIT